MWVIIKDDGESTWEKWYFKRKAYRKARHLKSARRSIMKITRMWPGFEGIITFK